ncbi:MULTISPECIES: Wzz/FepE/Etk N-terminal domain-containing protein [unclassified Pseudomonas]|uniref:Wzz/FepE/Etk N-terminal domain-containing protein n=1 Tax=unclassified Pseudomonas TaxID=196821 RepID=UPI00129D5BAD|nr:MULTISPECIES: Wzz/FepE/Etk N-terminal domain-containing protein [unclassified Pseudomonas]MDH4656627.1 hypothetical protein [Pseudomonas sp. BN606]MRK23025.1 hypothetical protein [Pseudomonas sp. JG-B]
MSNDYHGQMARDEIGLSTLLLALWERKLWVAIIAAACTLISVLYLSKGKPIYQAQVYLTPPTEIQVSTLNVGRGAGTEFAAYSSDRVFALLKKNLVSAQARQEYFKQISQTAAPMVTFSVEPSPERLVLVATGETSESVVQHAKGFLVVVDRLARKEITESSNEEFAVKRKSIKLEMAALRKVAKLRRADQIHRLQEALSVAESIKLVKMDASLAGRDAVAAISDSLMYLKGTEVLKAELRVLENRSSDDAFIPMLRTLQEKLEVLSVRDVRPEDVTAFNQDGRIVSSEVSVGPRKVVKVAIGLIFGLGLGVFLALAQFLIKRGRL